MARRGFRAGSIYPDEGRGWAVSVSLGKDENGKRFREVTRGNTKQDVEARLAELLALRVPQNSQNGAQISGRLISWIDN